MTNFLIFSVVALWLVVLALVVVVFALARQIGVLLERVTPVGAMINNAGPAIGDRSQEFALQSLTGGTTAVGAPSDKSTLVFFLSPSCPICKALIPALKAIRSAESQWLNVVMASDGDENEHRKFIEKEKLQVFPYVLSQDLGTSYRVAKLPFAVLLDGQGVIRAKGLINSREQLDSLFNAVELGLRSVQDFNRVLSQSSAS
jgi:methylamine dehydrogenase accessory protein MauD